MPEGLTKDFRTKRRAAHAAKHHVLESARAANAISESNEVVFDADHSIGHGQPTERVFDDLLMCLIFFPERCVLMPDAAHDIALLSFLDGSINCLLMLSQRCL